MQLSSRKLLIGAASVALAATCLAATQMDTASATPDRSNVTSTPIKHVVVLFDENVSFDHYFATYPHAANTDGTTFKALPGTPTANTLQNAKLLGKKNPNLYKPARLGPDQALTCDQNHSYAPEQKAADNGKMDAFVQNVSVDSCSGLYGAPGLTMQYYDGNTTTAMWNYAQQYAMSDNSYGSTFGPSTPGALNLIAGQTWGVHAVDPKTGKPTTDSYAVTSPNADGVGTVTNDPDPAYDDCSDKNHTATNNLAAMSGKNIGDQLNSRGVTWGWFQGGFRPTTAYAGAGSYAVCGATHQNIGGASSADYSPHHSPFQYYKSTSNPHHLPPSSVSKIGHTDQANHNYDLTDFSSALKGGNLPAVSFLKAAEYQDGHAGYSDPIDEQHFLVTQINAIEKSKYWKNTAIVIAYDDSDGWYDHAASLITNGSNNPALDTAMCSASGAPIAGKQADRCGPGPRLPMLVISPWSKTNYVDHKVTEQASVTKFIEDNWLTGRLGNHSFDQRAGSLNGMFNFKRPNGKQVILQQNGAVKTITWDCGRYGLPYC